MAGGLQQGIKAVLEDMGSTDFRSTQRMFHARGELTLVAKCLRDGGGWYIDQSAMRDSV